MMEVDDVDDVPFKTWVCLPGSVTPWPHAAGSFTAGRRPKGLVLVFLHLRVPYYQDVHLIDGYLWVVLSDLV